MTGFLASVATVDEMELVRDSGANIVDLKDPSRGALGAWDDASLRAAVARWRAWSGSKPQLSATIGDQPMTPDLVRAAAERVAATGVPLVKLGLFAGGDPCGCLSALSALGDRTQLIAVFFADASPDFSLLDAVAAASFHGAMVDTADKAAGGLRTQLGDDGLDMFVRRAKDLGLLSGLAGSLRLADVAPLVRVGPDYLGFRGALCDGGRTGRLEPAKLFQIAEALAAASADDAQGGDRPRIHRAP